MRIGTPSAFQKRRKILVCAVASYPNGLPVGVKIFLRSAMRHGIAVELFGTERKWENFYIDKVVRLREDLRPLAGDYDHVLLLDAADVVFARGLEEVMEASQEWDKMTFNAERCCYPDPGLAEHYPACETSYKYLNAGCWLGRMPDVLAQMDRLVALVQPGDWSGDDSRLWGDDQLLWTRYLLSGGGIGIDSQCEVFQTLHMVNDGELWDGINEETGTQPCIYHANGMNQCSAAYQRHT